MKGKLKMNKKWGHFVKAEGESDTVVVLPICMFAHPFCEKKKTTLCIKNKVCNLEGHP